MSIIPSFPYTLSNGTTADASQVMADLTQIQLDVNTYAAANGANADITSLSGLTTPLSANQGGTGIANNAASTITISGAHSLTAALTANTSVTFPTSGTLVNSAVTTLSSLTTASALASIGTITAGVWHGTVIGAQYGGTGQDFSASTGIIQVLSGILSASTALAAGTTGTTQAVGDSTTKLATTKFANPSSVLSASTFRVELPGGLILIGGNNPSPGNSGIISFSAFPTGAICGFAIDNTTSASNNHCGVTALTSSSLTYACSSAATILYWFALGY